MTGSRNKKLADIFLLRKKGRNRKKRKLRLAYFKGRDRFQYFLTYLLFVIGGIGGPNLNCSLGYAANSGSLLAESDRSLFSSLFVKTSLTLTILLLLIKLAINLPKCSASACVPSAPRSTTSHWFLAFGYLNSADCADQGIRRETLARPSAHVP